MGIDEKARERAILDVTAELLLRHGYNKVTMSDVADAVGDSLYLAQKGAESDADVLLEASVLFMNQILAIMKKPHQRLHAPDGRREDTGGDDAVPLHTGDGAIRARYAAKSHHHGDRGGQYLSALESGAGKNYRAGQP